MRNKERLMELYKKRKLSLGKAAELLGVSIHKFLEILEKKNISLNSDEKEIQEAVEEI